MFRNWLLGIVLLAFVAVAVGCGGSEPPRVDAPLQSSPAVNPKTGKANRNLEVTGEIK